MRCVKGKMVLSFLDRRGVENKPVGLELQTQAQRYRFQNIIQILMLALGEFWGRCNSLKI